MSCDSYFTILLLYNCETYIILEHNTSTRSYIIANSALDKAWSYQIAQANNKIIKTVDFKGLR